MRHFREVNCKAERKKRKRRQGSSAEGTATEESTIDALSVVQESTHHREVKREASSAEGTVADGSTSDAPNVVQEHTHHTNQATSMVQDSEDNEQGDQHLRTSASALWWGAGSKPPYPNAPDPQPACQTSTPYWSHSTTLAIRSRNAPALKVVEYEDTDSHEEHVVRMLIRRLARYHQIGDGVDPFVVLPQFQNPELNALVLLRKCK